MSDNMIIAFEGDEVGFGIEIPIENVRWPVLLGEFLGNLRRYGYVIQQEKIDAIMSVAQLGIRTEQSSGTPTEAEVHDYINKLLRS